MRAAPLNVLRLLLGVLSVLFAYQLGRVATRLHVNRQPLAKAITWFLRVFVTAFAIFWVGGFDGITIVVLALVALSFAAGVYNELRPKHQEEIHLDLK